MAATWANRRRHGKTIGHGVTRMYCKGMKAGRLVPVFVGSVRVKGRTLAPPIWNTPVKDAMECGL